MRALVAAILSAWAGTAFAQAANIPACNGTNGPNCTDYFGSGNWANSPLPAGSVGSLTLVAGGSGYANPVVVISDPSGSGATGTAAATGGVVMSVSGSGGSGYIIPQVAIVDVGVGGTLAAPTCGGAGQAACGSGAMATASLVGPFTGGILKFQDTLPNAPVVTNGALSRLPGGLTVAVPDTTTFPGSDYYEIALVQYQQKLHSSLPPTTLRGYMQLPTGSVGCPLTPAASYLGPSIVASKNRPVRVKFTNCLAAGSGGDLFIPVDTTYMGAGGGPNSGIYGQNRATLHLHGGASPWISDGTPHQWTVPLGDPNPLARGDSVAFVPDMYFQTTGQVVPQCSATVTTGCSPSALPAGATNDPGQGSLSLFWTNQQGGRLMFYHDHAYGLTRLNVYAGEAAGYLLVDPLEENALAAATAPGTVGASPDLTHVIPLVIQDKTFVPSAAQVAAQDPTWSPNFGTSVGVAMTGDLWFPHVYLPNQNPADPGGANAFGRWDYGAWFFPPQTSLTAANPPTAVTTSCTSSAFPGQLLGPTATCPTCGCPITPNPSGTPEGFMDTPLVNGVAYPVLHVAPAAYRFQILAAGNDRSWNLSWFVADSTGKDVSMLPAVPPATGSTLPLCGAVNPVAIPSLDMGLAMALLDNTGNPLNGTGLPAACWPNYGPQAGIPAPQTMWAADGRAGGAPDPRLAGPPWIQIGTEGGLLPTPVVIPATPVNYEQNTRSVTITNVAVHGLWLGPAERADVIVDFSKFAGKTLILFNDAPTPAPAFDSRNDYFTGDGDQSSIGGAPNTQPGYGPNTRTVMQVVVDGNAPNTVPFSLSALKAAFVSAAGAPSVFAQTQPTPVVPEAIYNQALATTSTNTYASIAATNLTFDPLALQSFDPPCSATAPAQCAILGQKAIQELFTTDYGRMNATLGTELPLTSFLNQTTIPLGYVDPPTEIIREGTSQLWKITHNGVDTHFVHFHLFNVQVVNRMGWDGTIRPPDPNEVGWKDTVRMNPLEDILVALQPITPQLPFPLRNSIRREDVTVAAGAPAPFTNIDPFTNNPVTTSNAPTNFGWEYVWHCHILGHEENDMMRPIVYQVAPPAPSNLVAAMDQLVPGQVNLSFTDNSASETGFTIQRDTTNAFSAPVIIAVGPSTLSTNAAGEGTDWGSTIKVTDTPGTTGTFYYRVQAVDDGFKAGPAGLSQSYNATPPLLSAWSALATAQYMAQVVTFTGAPASATFGTSFTVTAVTDSGVTPTITGTPGVCTVGPVTGASTNAQALVTMTSGTGTCALTASWPNGTTTSGVAFAPATATQSTTAVKALQTVTFTGAPASASYDATFGVAATTNASVMPTITGTAGVCTVGAVAGTAALAQASVHMVSGTGTCALTASWPADPNYQAAVAAQSTAAAKIGSATRITAMSPNPAVAGQPVTVSVGVASAVTLSSGMAGPSGTVTVSGGGQSCVATLTGGAGSCSPSFPTAGAIAVTATYAGDANFTGSASAASTEQVRDFRLTLSAPQTIPGNQRASYTATVTSLNGFTGTVSLGCSGNYPSRFSCGVSPTSVTVGAGGSASATLSVYTVRGYPGTYTITATGRSGTGIPASGGLTHTATTTVTTTR
jgi:FtsP/CotA-like multicopper oxidase with cupredoxin domain